MLSHATILAALSQLSGELGKQSSRHRGLTPSAGAIAFPRIMLALKVRADFLHEFALRGSPTTRAEPPVILRDRHEIGAVHEAWLGALAASDVVTLPA